MMYWLKFGDSDWIPTKANSVSGVKSVFGNRYWRVKKQRGLRVLMAVTRSKQVVPNEDAVIGHYAADGWHIDLFGDNHGGI